MTNPDDDAAPAPRWPHALVVSATAQGSQVRVLRRRLAAWLHGDHLDGDTIDDVVSAASEALENCCDHAYERARGAATMTLSARAQPGEAGGLEVDVADDGRWRPAPTDAGRRGRGLAMMRALVDDVTVEAGPRGTCVRLVHHGRREPGARP
ncbi:ATP-binding protein [Actinomycetospora soli]|uniref:ATP-binding protein n=1 Tax=Actinomycetospora soli TaxID=2893887 RepID=UPI001E47982A|nr:ATP-binding protein [Actinomycetospora soli]MCD2188992.1 ATP-binding protein [Actinomycetospora soli]